jgi:endonuclease YncB( thermonuclease family)
MIQRAAAPALLLLALLAPGAAGAQELGRLFFTPEQRAALDARRKARIPDKPAAVPQAALPVTRVNGAVHRADGRSTVWVNGEAIPELPQGDAPRVAPRDAARVTVPGAESSQRYDLRVGQSVDRASGEVRDVIGEGEIKVRRGGVAPRK